jgi:hypothetical protein
MAGNKGTTVPVFEKEIKLYQQWMVEARQRLENKTASLSNVW